MYVKAPIPTPLATLVTHAQLTCTTLRGGFRLWYGLKDFGDNWGLPQANSSCPSVPGPEKARAAAAAAAADGSYREKGLCVLDHYLRDPYK